MTFRSFSIPFLFKSFFNIFFACSLSIHGVTDFSQASRMTWKLFCRSGFYLEKNWNSGDSVVSPWPRALWDIGWKNNAQHITPANVSIDTTRHLSRKCQSSHNLIHWTVNSGNTLGLWSHHGRFKRTILTYINPYPSIIWAGCTPFGRIETDRNIARSIKLCSKYVPLIQGRAFYLYSEVAL